MQASSWARAYLCVHACATQQRAPLFFRRREHGGVVSPPGEVTARVVPHRALILSSVLQARGV